MLTMQARRCGVCCQYLVQYSTPDSLGRMHPPDLPVVETDKHDMASTPRPPHIGSHGTPVLTEGDDSPSHTPSLQHERPISRPGSEGSECSEALEGGDDERFVSQLPHFYHHHDSMPRRIKDEQRTFTIEMLTACRLCCAEWQTIQSALKQTSLSHAAFCIRCQIAIRWYSFSYDYRCARPHPPFRKH
jgi:hypothetical protein